jgi:hypothetical protein
MQTWSTRDATRNADAHYGQVNPAQTRRQSFHSLVSYRLRSSQTPANFTNMNITKLKVLPINVLEILGACSAGLRQRYGCANTVCTLRVCWHALSAVTHLDRLDNMDEPHGGVHHSRLSQHPRKQFLKSLIGQQFGPNLKYMPRQ